MWLEGLVWEQGLWAEQSFVCGAVSSCYYKHLVVSFSEDFPIGSFHQNVSRQSSPEKSAVLHSLLFHMGGCYFCFI